MTKKAIVIGATSGIGCELAKVLGEQGYAVGLTGRRLHLLQELENKWQYQAAVYTQVMDISQAQAIEDLKQLIERMDGVDLIVISAGIGVVDADLSCALEQETIAVNVLGFTAMANVAYHYFKQKGAGHLVGISSIAAIRGGAIPSYHASKAYVSNYLQGLRFITAKGRHQIFVTDVKPGFVDTAMAQGEGQFWVASPQKAAQQIFQAIKKKKKHVYITKRWRLVAWLLKILPESFYNKL